MSDTPSYTELQQSKAEAERMRDEAAADRKAAAEDRKAAEYAWGQSEFHNREVSAKERSVAERERRLKGELNEDALLARKVALDERDSAITEREREYDKAKYAALRVLTG